MSDFGGRIFRLSRSRTRPRSVSAGNGVQRLPALGILRDDRLGDAGQLGAAVLVEFDRVAARGEQPRHFGLHEPVEMGGLVDRFGEIGGAPFPFAGLGVRAEGGIDDDDVGVEVRVAVPAQPVCERGDERGRRPVALRARRPPVGRTEHHFHDGNHGIDRRRECGVNFGGGGGVCRRRERERF